MSEARQRRQGRIVSSWIGVLAIGLVALVPAATAAPLEDRDARGEAVSPSAEQKRIADRMATSVRWSELGTPRSLIRHGGFLTTGVAGADAVDAARNWLSANRSLFRLASVGDLEVTQNSRLGDSAGRVVGFRQRFGDLPAGVDGQVTLGLRSAGGAWDVAYVSSSLAPTAELSGERRLSATEAWARAAADVGRGAPGARIGQPKRDGSWSVFAVDGFAQAQRAREVAVPTPRDGVRRAWETLITDVRGGHATGYTHFIDAETGAVLIRQDNAMQSHPAADTFEGSVEPEDGACSTEGDWTVADGERVESIAAAVEATLTTNDVVLHLKRDGAVVASQDTLFSPEALVYDPPDAGVGTYTLDVCDFVDGHAWDDPRTYSGQIAFNGAAGSDAATPYPPMWKVFPAYPLIGNETFPWNYPSDDIRELWCWESTEGFPPQPVTGPGGEACDREVQNLASRLPWDVDGRTQQPTFTTDGNNASSAEAWGSPLTPGPAAQRPVSLRREYVYPWENRWHTRPERGCSQSNFTPGGNDIDAAVTNLFVMHNRMHDWAYFLGFTERRWNAQESNFGTGGTAENDPVLGDAQAGAVTGGFPSYLGRDNANMIPNPDGVAPITNMYLWQPIAGAFYAPCVDGDFDMAVIGHEYGHLIENRMIGKGGRRSQHHAGAMGESFGDLMGVEQLIESGYVPVGDENPFGVGTYVTGNKDRAIRNYGMNFPRTGAFPTPGVSLVKRGAPLVDPLGFANMGYDITGPQVHADGEIWSATNHDIRAALAAKYDGPFPSSDRALQRSCADGERSADQCPGNRRWMQIVFDAFLLMPVAPSMLDARDAYLAADMMRFGGANQSELWLAFARRGFGVQATSSNTANDTDTDPTPDYASPRHGAANVRFRAVASDEGGAAVNNARFYVGHYEARTSPVADTNPATSGQNLDDRARFAPGTYEFVVHAPGYGHLRLRRTFAAGSSPTVTAELPTNRASLSKGATAAVDGEDHEELIDDTEGTSWDRRGAQPNVRGSQVTVDLQGGVQRIRRAQVSALLEVGQNRFTALRQFRIDVSTNGTTFRPHYTSPANAFPGFNPRPVAPEMILRSFSFPAVNASHVRIVVLDNQCTGNTAFHGDQDSDPTSGSDCRLGSPGAGTVPVFGDLPQVVAPRDNEVHIAELQVFSSGTGTDGGGGGDGGGGNGGGGNGGGGNGGGGNGDGGNGDGDDGGDDDNGGDDDDGGDDLSGLRP
jgi:extracellular elastinolytic metalloproteinase